MTLWKNLGSRNILAALLVAASTACSGDTPKKATTTDTASTTAKPTVATDTAARAATDNAPAYVGQRYDPLPTGVSYEGGAVLMGTDGKPSSFALTHVLTPKGNYLWLDSILPNDGPVRARIVRAELKVRRLQGEEALFIGSCDVDKKLDPAVVAIAAREFNVRTLKKVHDAWRADSRTGSFAPLATTGVTCENVGIK